MPTPSTSPPTDQPYTVVWNDAVDLRHLTASIVICTGISLPVFLVARSLFAPLAATPALAGGYALLVGLLACVASAALCSRLFRPKRTFGTEERANRETVLAELERLGGTAESFAELPAHVQAEMTELGLAPDPDPVAAPIAADADVRTGITVQQGDRA